jgi:hypothetical protein
VIASIVHELFLRRGERPPLPNPTDLLTCNRDVGDLLEGLGRTAAELQREAATGDPEDLGGRWERFAADWQERWHKVNRRCRFDELADTGLGPAYDRMAWVHRNLPGVKLKYREAMKRFTDEQAGEIKEMREALKRSHALLEKREKESR